MRRRKRRNGPGELIREKAVPVTVDEFKLACEIYGAAASGKMPTRSPAKEGSIIVEDFGVVSFGDIPMTRGMFALKHNFPKDRFSALLLRVWAYGELHHDDPEAFSRWLKGGTGPDSGELHEAIAEVAATMPLSTNGKFNRRLFWKAVEERGAGGWR